MVLKQQGLGKLCDKYPCKNNNRELGCSELFFIGTFIMSCMLTCYTES